MNNKVSVIIPYYKNIKEIKRTLQCVINQTFDDFEVIIINDGSPDWDEASIIIESFNDARLKFFSHDYNKNGAAARNTGIRIASGNYIAFLDADDEWLPNHLDETIRILNASNADIVYTQALVKSSGKDEIMPLKGISEEQKVSDYLFVEGGLIFTPTIVVKTELAKKVLFNESLHRHQDYDFLMRSKTENINITFLNKPTVIVHWENNDIQQKGGTWDFSLKFAKDYRSHFSNRSYSNFIFKFAILANLKEKKKKRALKLLIKETNPFLLTRLNAYLFFCFFLFGKFKHPYKWKK